MEKKATPIGSRLQDAYDEETSRGRPLAVLFLLAALAVLFVWRVGAVELAAS